MTIILGHTWLMGHNPNIDWHCIVTLQLWVGIWLIPSSHALYLTHMRGPLYLPLATLHPSSPQDTHGPSGPPYMTYCLASHLIRTPHSLSDQSFCQDSMHSGAPSGLEILIGNWVQLRYHWLGFHAMVHMSGTWSSHPNTAIHMRNLWKAVAHHQGWMF